MNKSCLTVVILFGISACVQPPEQRTQGTASSIVLDGDFSDWADLSPTVLDQVGDAGAESLDFGNIWVANDHQALYLRIEVGLETILQNPMEEDAGNDLRVYLDTDGDLKTGYKFESSGYDLELFLGEKRAIYHAPAGPLQMTLNEVGIVTSPTHSSDEFEIRIPFTVRLNLQTDTPLIVPSSQVKILLQDGTAGDRIPDTGAISHTVTAFEKPVLETISLERHQSEDIRIISHNVHDNEIAYNSEPFSRYLSVLKPDIINFQEVEDGEQLRKLVEKILPLNGESRWHYGQMADCVTLSRFPLLAEHPIGYDLLVRIDLPNDLSSSELVVFNAHSPCCGRNKGRDYQHDKLASVWRDLLGGKGPIEINPLDTVVFLGDFNMVGFKRQLLSLRDGNLHDNENFGPDFSPAREMGSLISAPLRHTHDLFNFTWWNQWDAFTPGKLDYIFFSPDTATLQNNFTLWTPEIPVEELAKYGLKLTDSFASDHLPLVADFQFE